MTPTPWSGGPRRAILVAASLWAAYGCVREVRYLPSAAAPAPLDGVQATLYLVGDAGEANAARDSVLGHLQREIAEQTARYAGTPVVVAFLGDNIYEAGARRGYRAEDVAHLAEQTSALGTSPDVRGIFVPGNHGWSRGAGDERARRAVLLQQEWVQEIARARNVTFLPRDACPGPAPVEVASDVQLLVIDTEWLLRLPDDGCGSAEAFYDRLRAELQARRDARVVVLSHHPMATGGPHGGNVSLVEKAPVVYYLAVKSGLGVQDLASGRYSRMLDGLRSAYAASGAPPLVHAAGHDHSLQVIRTADAGEPAYQLVSGSASKRSPVGRVAGTRYATSSHGYVRLEFGRSEVRATVYAAESFPGPLRVVYSCTLSGPEERDRCVEAPRSPEER